MAANPARFAVERPRVVLLATLLMLIYGVLSYQGLPRQENPSLQARFASVITYLPGAEPEKVEMLVTEILEDEIAALDDIEEIFTRTGRGVSFMLIEIEEGAPATERLQQIREKVQGARAYFPEGTSEPEVDTRVFRTNTMVLALSGEDLPPLALREQAKDLKRELEELGDIRRVELVGLPEEEIEVALDMRLLSQRGVPLQQVLDSLAARNIQLPSGELEVGVVRSSIRTSGAFRSAEDVGETFLGTGAGGLPIRLSDVGSVTRKLADPEERVRALGRPAVGIALEMLPGRNAIAVGQRVRARIDELAPARPPGMQVSVVADEPYYVEARLTLLTGSLLLGLVLVVSLALFGMGWRSGAVVSVTIPLALTVAMGIQGIFDVPLHQISIAALVIAIGIVVDESIVVTDNIQRHLELGRPPREAAIEGLGEIHLAVLAGAATTVAAFIPLMVMEGDIGEFIRSIPVVVSVMLLGSVLVSHFVTPLLAIFVHTHFGSGRPPRERTRVEQLYRPLLAFVTRRSRMVLLVFAGTLTLILTVAGGLLWPPSFFPDADRHQFLINVSLPSGSPLAETEAVMTRIENRLSGDEDLEDWTAFIGTEAPKFYYNEFTGGRAEHRGQFVVNTRESVPFHRTRQVVDRIDADLDAHVAGASIRTAVLRQGYGGGEDIEIFILGDNLAVLRTLAVKLRGIVEGIPGVKNVRDSFGYDPITLQARVDDATANLLGVTHFEVATTLRSAIDGITATTFREDDEEVDIRVRIAAAQRRDIADLAALPIFSPVAGSTVPLSHVASLEPGWTTRVVQRYNRKREAVVEADVETGYSLLEVTREVETAVRGQVSFPSGYSAAFFGQRKEVTESFLSLAKAAIVAVFLIYIILVVRFQSMLQPVLILLAIPMAVVGSCVGLAITGNPLSFMAFLGMISLTGIAVNDSIVLVDTINRLRSQGLELREAIVTGAFTRLRAVTMTSVTTIGGLIPLSLYGGAFWAPFGFAMIFGLAASTVLTLVVQPAAYLTLERGRPTWAERS